MTLAPLGISRDLWVLSPESALGGNVRRHKIRGYRAALTLRIRNKAGARSEAKTDEINRIKMKIYQQQREALQREVASRAGILVNERIF